MTPAPTYSYPGFEYWDGSGWRSVDDFYNNIFDIATWWEVSEVPKKKKGAKKVVGKKGKK